MVWIEFLICAAGLTFFAYRLCRQGILISANSRIAESVIGVFFLAIATSFPEIVTSTAAVFVLKRVELGYGDIIGSIAVNFMILAGVDYLSGRGRVMLKMSGLNRTAAVIMVFMLLVILTGSVLRAIGVPVPSVGLVGIENVLLLVMYLASFRWLREIEKEETGMAGKTSEKIISMWAKFSALLVAVMFLGVWMAHIAEKIVLVTGLTQSFTGTLLLGFTTSLPEIIVSLAAIKAGSVNMSIANILGSNLFDAAIIPFLDMMTGQPILALLTPGLMIATVTAFAISIVVVGSFLIKKDTRWRVNPDTGFIFFIGLITFVVLYFVR